MGEPLLVTIGECLGLVNGMGAGGLGYGSHAELGFGGAEGNVAIGASRLGARTSWIGRIGDDPFGHRIVRTLRGEGVDVREIWDPDRFTAMMLKDRTGDGLTRVSYLRRGAAGGRIEPSDLPRELIERATVLHLTGITPGLGEHARDAVFSASRIARDAGALVSFDINHRSGVWAAEEAAPVYRELIAMADIVFAGADEAALVVGGATPVEQARMLLELGPSQAIVKLGSEGAVAVADGVEHAEPSVRVQALDTVGAGDAFVAGYLVELMAGAALPARMRTAAACGAHACLGPGDWESMPTREQLRRLLSYRDPVDR